MRGHNFHGIDQKLYVRSQEAWFNDFWGKVGAGMKAGAVDLVLPLLDGRVSGGKILDEP